MILYSKATLRIAELHFKQAEAPPTVDIVRYQSRLEPVTGTSCSRRSTILIDLTQPRDQLLAAMGKTTRREIRQAQRDNGAVEFCRDPDNSCLTAFFRYWDRFAPLKGLPPLNKQRLAGMQRSGALALSRARAEDGEELSWHCYVYTPDWARLLHSASLYRAVADKEYATRVSRANRFLHWSDMCQFQEMGVATYDLGGWYDGTEDTEKLNINRFKEGFGGQVVPVYYSDVGVSLRGNVAVRLNRLMKRAK